MKKFKRYLGFAVICALLTTSCSKDGEMNSDPVDPTAPATLSFATVLNDMMNIKAASKQSGGLPECSDAVPDHVAIVLSGPENVGTMADPYEVAVNPTPGDYDSDGEDEYFTEYDAGLELPPGTYTLEYFVVYDSGGNIIWVAPTETGDFAGFVDDPLPVDINLAGGVKKYANVEVLCFDDREVNKYGYLFFDIETTELYEFCFFINYCDDNGRHFPAKYSVDFYLGINASGTPLYLNASNSVGFYDADDRPYADPLCFALPNLTVFEDGEGYLYYEITLENWSDVYGDVEQVMISGILSRDDIEANFEGENNVNYEHLRFGCETPPDGEDCEGDEDCDGVPNEEDVCPGYDDTIDADKDGIADGCDNCPKTANENQIDDDGDGVGKVCDECIGELGTPETNGCADIGEPPVDTDGDGVPDGEDDCPEEAGPAANKGCPEAPLDTDGDGVPDTEDECPEIAGPAANNGCPEAPVDTDGDGVPDDQDECPEIAGPAANNGCPETPVDTDGDGVPDGQDDCPNEAGPAANNGCPEEQELCTIPEPSGDCTSAYLEQAGNTGFVEVTDDLPLDLYVGNTFIGTFTVAIANGNVVVGSELTVEGEYLWSGYQIYVSSSSNSSGVFGSVCDSVDPIGMLSVSLGDTNIDYPVYVQLKANVCPAN